MTLSSIYDLLKGLRVSLWEVKLQTSSTMNYFNSTLDSSNQSNSKAVTMERLQALLELFWTPNLEFLFLDAEFCELSYEEQQAVINELMD